MDHVNNIVNVGGHHATSVYGFNVSTRKEVGVTGPVMLYGISGDSKGNLISKAGVYIKSATYEKKANKYGFKWFDSIRDRT